GYFATVGSRIVRGRPFVDADREGSELVVIVNETMARTYWPNANPLTKCIIVQGSDLCRRVVGVAADALQWKLHEDASMQYYLPYGQEDGSTGGPLLLVRPKGDPEEFIPHLHRLLARLVPGAADIDIKTLERQLDPQVRPWRVGAQLFGLF